MGLTESETHKEIKNMGQTQFYKILNLTCEFLCITGAGGGGAARGNLFGEAAGALFGGGGGERETMCELCGGKGLVVIFSQGDHVPTTFY